MSSSVFIKSENPEQQNQHEKRPAETAPDSHAHKRVRVSADGHEGASTSTPVQHVAAAAPLQIPLLPPKNTREGLWYILCCLASFAPPGRPVLLIEPEGRPYRPLIASGRAIHPAQASEPLLLAPFWHQSRWALVAVEATAAGRWNTPTIYIPHDLHEEHNDTDDFWTLTSHPNLSKFLIDLIGSDSANSLSTLGWHRSRSPLSFVSTKLAASEIDRGFLAVCTIALFRINSAHEIIPGYFDEHLAYRMFRGFRGYRDQPLEKSRHIKFNNIYRANNIKAVEDMLRIETPAQPQRSSVSRDRVCEGLEQSFQASVDGLHTLHKRRESLGRLCNYRNQTYGARSDHLAYLIGLYLGEVQHLRLDERTRLSMAETTANIDKWRAKFGILSGLASNFAAVGDADGGVEGFPLGAQAAREVESRHATPGNPFLQRSEALEATLERAVLEMQRWPKELHAIFDRIEAGHAGANDMDDI